MSRTAAGHWIGITVCVCFLFLGTADAACSSTCLYNTVDSTAPVCNETTGECLYGCKAGYAGIQCQIPCGENCLKCSVRCTEMCSRGCNDNQEPPCYQNGTCKEGCKHNFWGPNCLDCNKNCSENTAQENSICSETDGHCLFGCESGNYGIHCDKRCNSNCQENSTSDPPICAQKDGTCIFGCKSEEYYGPKCNMHCGHRCLKDLCDRDGNCRGCRFDLTGPRCFESCSVGCVKTQDPRCHQNGTCKEGCATNFWGPTCTACSENCAGDKSKSEGICRWSDGFCLQGCKPGKYGIHCSDDCSENCKDKWAMHQQM